VEGRRRLMMENVEEDESGIRISRWGRCYIGKMIEKGCLLLFHFVSLLNPKNCHSNRLFYFP